MTDTDTSAAPSHTPGDVPEQRAGVGDADAPTPADLERAEWLEWRRHGIGASDVAAIVGQSPWASPFSVWADKAGLTAPSESTDAMRFGQLAEHVIGPWFTERTGLPLVDVQARCEHPDHPWRRCTIDGATDEADSAVVEMKATSASADEWAEEIPMHYRIQASWQCHVTGRTRAYFAVLHVAYGRMQFEVYPFEPEPDDIDWLAGKVTEFWTKHVLTGKAPEGDAAHATADAIGEVWGGIDPDGVIEADDDPGLLACIVAYKRAQRDKKAVEDREREAKNKLRIRMGEHEVVAVGGKPALSWKSQTRGDTKFRVLRLHKNGAI